MEKKKYYLGLDIGTDSVGYAVTDKEYNLIKFHGEPAWGVTVFDKAGGCEKRRMRRTARRRLDRKKIRIQLLQELFAVEIAKVDEKFYKRLRESYLYREDAEDQYTLFCDPNYTDKDYYRQYPTIHHLITDLMESVEPHDVRLVYLACAWLIAHRGHFLSNVSKDNLTEIRDFEATFDKLNQFLEEKGCQIPWRGRNIENISVALKKKESVKDKVKSLTVAMLGEKKLPKESQEDFPYSLEAIIKLLAGGKCKLKELFVNDDYEEIGSISLDMDEKKFAEIMSAIGEDYDVIAALRAIYDWSILSDILGNKKSISEAKKIVYYQHKEDLAFLKHVLCKYNPDNYDRMFRNPGKDDNYTSYVYHTDEAYTKEFKKSKGKEDFCKYVLKMVESIKPDNEDEEQFEDMIRRLELRTFMPKQKNTDNRVIPYQLYWDELDQILKNAETYLPFLLEQDEEKNSVSDKIRSIFLFRVPYFVGPLNEHSNYSWLKRKQGKIYPWNFEQMVDLEESEEQFIRRMTNTCTYLPGEVVLPKDSLYYHKFMVLNEINTIAINGQRIPVKLKQQIYEELFMKKKKITRKKLIGYLISNGIIEKNQETMISGIDEEIHSDLTPQISFRRLLQQEILSETDVERIIERSSYAEDKERLNRWVQKQYPNLSEEDRKYICSIKIKDFGRLSKKFLCEIEGIDTKTGEIFTIISALWNTQNNLMELLSERYTFKQVIDQYVEEYYSENFCKLEQRLDEMSISSAVRRSIYRTIDVIKDITKAFGKPEKIFIEMTRGGTAEQKNKRTKSRKQQILELYETCKEENVRLLKQQLEALGDDADNKLRGDVLFLYYMQFGKCMYSGDSIEYNSLAGKGVFNIEHIYPRSVVKDDSILNNKVLVRSEINGEKDATYPIASDIRVKMTPCWKILKEKGAITEEKFRRLTRSTPFTEEEKWGFINRQLTETSQATKAIADLLKERYPQAEIVYCKAGLVSEFRQEFDLLKSRTYNDLHHAVDAYLNIVVGNVYNMKFSKRWFNITSNYSVKCKTIFTHPVICGRTMVWDGETMLKKVKKIAVRSNAHFTKYAFYKTGGLFDQNPVSKAEGLIPRKKGMNTEKYGGYNKAAIMFFIPVHYKSGKKEDTIILPVELMYGDQFLNDKLFAEKYALNRVQSIIGKSVEEISFPLGMRPWKINTVLSLDEFRMCITGLSNGGKILCMQSIMQFSAGLYWNNYVKRLESLVNKVKNNESYVFSEKYDKVSREENEKLYDLYVDKLEKTIYQKRLSIKIPLGILINGTCMFKELSEIKQAETLLNIHELFGRVSGGSDLSSIGGKKNSGATTCSTIVSNWKKGYKDVRLVDMSPSGLWEQQSENLLDLL